MPASYPGAQTYQFLAKKYAFDLLKDRYAANEQFIDRITYHLATEQDVRDFAKLFVDAYEQGFLKAVNDYKEQLRKIGYEVNIMAEK